MPQFTQAKLIKVHCMLCGYGCHDNSELHGKDVHEVSCNKCDKTFFTSFDHIVHTASAHGQAQDPPMLADAYLSPQLKLFLCPKSFPSQSLNNVFNLITDFLITNPHSLAPEPLTDHPLFGESLICDYCPSTFQSETCLDTHVVESHHVNLVEQIVKFDEFMFNCEYCIFGSNGKVKLDNHMQKKHDLIDSDPVILQPTSSHHCKFCSSVFEKESSLDDHIHLEHSKPAPINLFCNSSNSMFYKQEFLDEHMVTIHKHPDKTHQPEVHPFTC